MSKSVFDIEGCDKKCWASFHMTGGYHRTDCALSKAFGHQLDNLNKEDVAKAQKLLKEK